MTNYVRVRVESTEDISHKIMDVYLEDFDSKGARGRLVTGI